MSTALQQVRRLITSLVMTLVTSLVLYFANHILGVVLAGLQPSALPFVSKRTRNLNSHEAQIAQNIVQPEGIKERMNDIGGLEAIKDEIRSQVLLPLRHSKIFFSSVKALHPPRGILLHGPPGTGKTMLARAIAAEAGCPFLSLTLSNLENKFFGESSKLLQATFSLARKLQPCVLFFDEIDGMIRTRTDHDQSCVYGFKTEFLTHMDGIGTKDTDAIIVIGCTNCADKLDPAVKRRLPRQYKIDLPNDDEIVDIFLLNLAGTGMTRNELRDVVSQMKRGASGSDIANIVRDAWTIQLLQHTKTLSFLRRLEQNDTTAEDIERIVGRIKPRHILSALKAQGWLEPPPEDHATDDDERPPP